MKKLFYALTAATILFVAVEQTEASCATDLLEKEKYSLKQVLECVVDSEKKASIPKEIVVASTVECSRLGHGWSVFKPATARFIIGAGRQFDEAYRYWYKEQEGTSTERKALSIRNLNSSDGEEEHVLTKAQMPKHNHTLISAYIDRGLDWKGNKPNNPSRLPTPHTQPQTDKDSTHNWYGGNSSPHNNMPPFIALNFCKRG